MRHQLIVGIVFALLCIHFSETRYVQRRNTNLFKTLKMNATQTKVKADDLRCSYVQVDEGMSQSIVGYFPKVSKKVAHHMLLFGCEALPELQPENLRGEPWDCSHSGIEPCGAKEQQAQGDIIYAWALDAPKFKFPKNTGYRIGGKSGINYLVLQTHFTKDLEINDEDDPRLTVEITTEKLPYQVGFYILGNRGFIPPKTKEVHLESACYANITYSFVPINYRTHSHNLGRITSGYLIRDNKWIEIGRMDPQQPQMFYPVTTKNLLIQENDILAARCTMDSSSRQEITIFGPRNQDEMCNFYIMYYTDYPEKISNLMCFTDAQNFSWSKDLFDVPSPPENASNLNGVKLLESNHGMHHSHSHE